MKLIIKRCLMNVIRACKKYNVSFEEILNEIANEQLKKELQNKP